MIQTHFLAKTDEILAPGVLPTKIHEVTPCLKRPNRDTVFSGVMAVNKDSWHGLPTEVQAATTAAGQHCSDAHAQDLLARTEVFFEAIKARAPRVGIVLGALFDLTAAATFAPDAWSTLGILERDGEAQVLARAVHAHIHHRVFLNGNKTVVFPASPGSYASERMG